VHYALPQGASGTLSVYVNGTKLSKELSLTSAYSYISTPGIMGSQTHKLYDDARMMFGQTYRPAHGAPGGGLLDTALPYTIAWRTSTTCRPPPPARQLHLGDQRWRRPDRRRRLHHRVPERDLRGQRGRGVRLDPSGTYVVSSALQVNSATNRRGRRLVLAGQDQ